MVGLRIKAFMDANGIKYGFLSEKMGMTPSVISDLLNGKRKIDCVEYYKICKYLRVPLDSFLQDEEEA